MKKVFVIALIALMTLFMWKDAVIYGVFKFQQDYISQNQCVDRNKPVNHCGGSCVLTERLAQPLNEMPSNNSVPVIVQVKMELFFELENELFYSDFNESLPVDYYKKVKLKGYLPTQIKPPQTV